jgi:sulfopyruvate decarboxylase subunit alpha
MTTISDVPVELQSPSGSKIIEAIKQAGIEFVISVPDIVTSDGLLWPLSTDPDLKRVRV